MGKIKITNNSQVLQQIAAHRTYVLAAGGFVVLDEAERSIFESLPQFKVEMAPETRKEQVADAMPEASSQTESQHTSLYELGTRELVEKGVELSIIENRGGSWLKFRKLRAQGVAKFTALLDTSPNVKERLISEIAKVSEQGSR